MHSATLSPLWSACSSSSHSLAGPSTWWIHGDSRRDGLHSKNLSVPVASQIAAARSGGDTVDIALPSPSLSLASHDMHPRQAPTVCETDTSSHIDDVNREQIRKDKTSWDYILRSGLAGGVAGCMAKTAIAPLDRVKILFQAQNPEFRKYSGRWLGVFAAANEIVKNQGPLALFQGHTATLLRIFPYAAIKYMAYDKLHFYLMPTKDMETSARLFAAGSMSGVLSVFMTYPLELIRVRLAFETKRKRREGSLRDIIRKIHSEGSTEAPFSSDARRRAGRNANASGGASTTAAATTTRVPLTTSAVQAAAIADGATAFSPVPLNPSPNVAAETTNRLLTRFPILKFYRGFSVTVLGMIPYAGTSFLVFGRCKTLLHRIFPADAPASSKRWYWPSKTMTDLGAGALAGAISQTTAYPFEVIRRRQQIGGIIRPGHMLGMVETARWIWTTSGWRGFYVGLSIGFLKVVPMTSISFAVWMGMKRQMGI